MHLFWHRGYESTSIQDLVNAMGINRGSLYAAFGDKRRLYLSALGRYRQERTKRAIAVMELELPPKEAIGRIFSAMIGVVEDNEDRRGCFIWNAINENALHDEEVADVANDTLNNTETCVREMLERGVAAGTVSPKHDPAALAGYFVGCIGGVRALVKAGRDPEELKKTVEIILSVLD